jgi:hypothetical protein
MSVRPKFSLDGETSREPCCVVCIEALRRASSVMDVCRAFLPPPCDGRERFGAESVRGGSDECLPTGRVPL